MRGANGHFSCSLVSRSSVALFQSGKNASHPDKRLSAYLPAHTCTALYMPLLFQPMRRSRIGFQRAPHFVGVLDEGRVHAPESGKHLLHAGKERRVSLPVPSFLAIVSVKHRRNAALASLSQISKASLGRHVTVRGAGWEGGARKEGRKESHRKCGKMGIYQLAAHTDKHWYTVTVHSQPIGLLRPGTQVGAYTMRLSQ